MKLIFNAVYAAIFLAWARKITDKVTEEFKWEIPYYRVDESGCYNVLVDDQAIAYSFNRSTAGRLAHAIAAEFPVLVGRIKITEDDDAVVDDDQIRGLDAHARKKLSEIIREFDED